MQIPLSAIDGVLHRLAAYDKTGMRHVYDMWPELAAESYGQGPAPLEIRNIRHMVFAGMGGSGALGDFFGALLSGMNIHVSKVRGYHLPRTVGSDTLLVCCSVSGNTAESLSVLEKAEGVCPRVVFTSGGRISEYCNRKGITCYNPKQVHSPRASFVSFLYAMLRVLGSDIVARNDVLDSIAQLERLRASINSGNMTANNPALDLAKWIRGIPIIYYPWGLEAAAVRFKNSLQENAKNHAMVEDVLEASHNGVVAWEREAPVCPIMIRGPDDNVKTRERWGVFQEFFESNSIPYRVVDASKGHIVSKLMGLVYLLDYASVYLAAINGVDPAPVRSIDFIKERTSCPRPE